MRTPFFIALLIASLPTQVLAQAASTPGTPTAPHPTLEHISIEWPVSGDTDLDGAVTVRFREVGGTYRQGLPLFHVPASSNEGFTWAHRHAGSLFGLTPDTTYDIELTLIDPDGGGTTTTLMARTRPVPVASATSRRVDVTPETLAAALADLTAGDLLVLGAGTYPSITIAEDGTEASPIVLRGADVGDVVIDGDLRLDGRSFVYVESLTVRGQVKLNAGERIAVMGCVIEAGLGDTGFGIVAYGEGSTDGYFADNVIIGRTIWAEASLGVDGDNIGEGIELTGPGNVIAHNRIHGFRDCISLMEDDEASNQVSVDILRNDLDVCVDDAIEADFAMGNVRVIGNRATNSFIAWSSQPSLGGPTYFIRNVSFNGIFQSFKPNRGSVGDVLLHNTLVKSGDAMGVYAGRTWSRAVFRNNLFIGGSGGGTWNGFSSGDGAVIRAEDADETCDFDYDGFGSHGTGTFTGTIGAIDFDRFAELIASGHEAHATAVDVTVFAAAFAFPDAPFPARAPVDLRLAAGSAAIDEGIALANVNDGFAGAAPDLGAYELGAGLPLYGPRSGEATCGNGAREVGEQCDDGNVTAGDGCGPSCVTETDGGPGSEDGGGGCGCRAATSSGDGTGAAISFAVLALVVRRRRHAGVSRRIAA